MSSPPRAPAPRTGNLRRHPLHPSSFLRLSSAAPRSWTRWSRAWPARCSEAPHPAVLPSSSSMRGHSAGAPASLLPACSAVPSRDPPEPRNPSKKTQCVSVSHFNKRVSFIPSALCPYWSNAGPSLAFDWLLSLGWMFSLTSLMMKFRTLPRGGTGGLPPGLLSRIKLGSQAPTFAEIDRWTGRLRGKFQCNLNGPPSQSWEESRRDGLWETECLPQA